MNWLTRPLNRKVSKNFSVWWPSSLDPFLIAAEGKVVSKLSASVTVPLAVSLLLGVFYILNMEYTPGVRNIYAFFESILLNKPEQAKKE